VSKLRERATYERAAAGLARESEQLLAVVDAQLARLEAAKGEDNEAAIVWDVERELLDIARKFERAQLTLVPHTDRRFNAAQRLLAEPTLNYPLEQARAARAAAA
jgi:DNA replication initiation complex subunit (GINS family)